MLLGSLRKQPSSAGVSLSLTPSSTPAENAKVTRQLPKNGAGQSHSRTFWSNVVPLRWMLGLRSNRTEKRSYPLAAQPSLAHRSVLHRRPSFTVDICGAACLSLTRRNDDIFWGLTLPLVLQVTGNESTNSRTKCLCRTPKAWFQGLEEDPKSYLASLVGFLKHCGA